MTDPSGTLTPQQIRTASERVAAILSQRGVTARIDVFGGASLALVHAPTRTATADVDGSYMPSRRSRTPPIRWRTRWVSSLAG